MNPNANHTPDSSSFDSATPSPEKSDDSALPLRLALRKQAEQQETKHLLLFVLLWGVMLVGGMLALWLLGFGKGAFVIGHFGGLIFAALISMFFGHRRWPLPACPHCGTGLGHRWLSQSGQCPKCKALVAREGEIDDLPDPGESAAPAEPSRPLPHRQAALDALEHRADVDRRILTPLQVALFLFVVACAWFGWDDSASRAAGWSLPKWIGCFVLAWLVLEGSLEFLVGRWTGMILALGCPWCRMVLSAGKYRKSVEDGACVLCGGAFTAESRAAREAAGESPAPPPKPAAPLVEPPRVQVDPATLPTRAELKTKAARFRFLQGGCLWGAVLIAAGFVPPLFLFEQAARWLPKSEPGETRSIIWFILSMVVLCSWILFVFYLEGKRLKWLERKLGLRCPWCDASIRVNPMALRHKDRFLTHVVQGGHCPACGRVLVSNP